MVVMSVDVLRLVWLKSLCEFAGEHPEWTQDASELRKAGVLTAAG
jgi:hypothetical protein